MKYYNIIYPFMSSIGFYQEEYVHKVGEFSQDDVQSVHLEPIQQMSIIRPTKLNLQLCGLHFTFYNLPDGHHGCNLPGNILLRLSQSWVL